MLVPPLVVQEDLQLSHMIVSFVSNIIDPFPGSLIDLLNSGGQVMMALVYGDYGYHTLGCGFRRVWVCGC